MTSAPVLSIVVPVLDEEASIGPFLDACRPHAEAAARLVAPDAQPEWVFVNDGSTDGTAAAITLASEADPRVKLVNLSRNFGKEAALAAGLDHAAGQAVVPMDVDLQDPPEVLLPMVRAWRDGAQVVDARRSTRDGDGWAKRTVARAFYRAYNRIADAPIPADVGDFRLLSRQAVDVVRRLPERARFNKGMVSWAGFRVATVAYERPARAAGTSRWGFWKLWNLALDGITASTTAPLRVWTYVGVVIAGLAFAYALVLVVRVLALGIDVPGYASLMVTLLTLSGLQLIGFGIMGEYVGRIATEVRGRPIYVVESTVGIAPDGARSAG